jgi:hypothetical protein
MNKDKIAAALYARSMGWSSNSKKIEAWEDMSPYDKAYWLYLAEAIQDVEEDELFGQKIDNSPDRGVTDLKASAPAAPTFKAIGPSGQDLKRAVELLDAIVKHFEKAARIDFNSNMLYSQVIEVIRLLTKG